MARGVIDARRHLIVAGKDCGGARAQLQQFFRSSDSGFVGVGAIDDVARREIDAAVFEAGEEAFPAFFAGAETWWAGDEADARVAEVGEMLCGFSGGEAVGGRNEVSRLVDHG